VRRRRPGHGDDRRAPALTEPLLLIAGLGQGPWAWRWVAPLLAREHEVHVLVARGTGKLAHLPPRRSVPEMANDAAELLAGRAAHVVGLSMGGYVALTLALARPELVRSLFLIGTGAGGPDRVPRPKEVREAYEAAVQLPLGEYERATTPLTLAPGWPEANPERFEEIIAARVGDGATIQTMWAHLDACYGYYAKGVPVEQIEAPAFVLHGAEDRVVPPENGRMLAARLPNAEYVELEGRGHNLSLEIPEELATLVAAFVGTRTAPVV
jgi:pimeloyl-ACP methyl ester carboxylesterase